MSWSVTGSGRCADPARRKGSIALLQLADVVASGGDAIITPDGPRGPVYELEGGIIFLAQKTRTAIVPG